MAAVGEQLHPGVGGDHRQVGRRQGVGRIEQNLDAPTSVQEVNQLLRQYAQMRKMFKDMGGTLPGPTQFLVDLSNVGGIARIVSFIGVGVLMLVIGYVAPLPAAGNGD